MVEAADEMQIAVPRIKLESIADERAFAAGLEGVVFRLQIDGAKTRPIEKRDESKRRRRMRTELRQQIVFDHAGGDDVFEDVDIAAGDIDVRDVVDLERVRGLCVRHVTNDIDESITDVAIDRAEKIGEKDRRPFEDGEQEDDAAAGVAADLGTESRNAARDLVRAEDCFDLAHA